MRTERRGASRRKPWRSYARTFMRASSIARERCNRLPVEDGVARSVRDLHASRKQDRHAPLRRKPFGAPGTRDGGDWDAQSTGDRNAEAVAKSDPLVPRRRRPGAFVQRLFGFGIWAVGFLAWAVLVACSNQESEESRGPFVTDDSLRSRIVVKNGLLPERENWYLDLLGLTLENANSRNRAEFHATWESSEVLVVQCRSTYPTGAHLQLRLSFSGKSLAGCTIGGTWYEHVRVGPFPQSGPIEAHDGLVVADWRDDGVRVVFAVTGSVSPKQWSPDGEGCVMGGFAVPHR